MHIFKILASLYSWADSFSCEKLHIELHRYLIINKNCHFPELYSIGPLGTGLGMWFCFIWFFMSHQQSFSYVGTGLPGLNQKKARINVSCSRTQCSDAGEARTSGPSVSSQALHHWGVWWLSLKKEPYQSCIFHLGWYLGMMKFSTLSWSKQINK